jgi:hypothetical protein
VKKNKNDMSTDIKGALPELPAILHKPIKPPLMVVGGFFSSSLSFFASAGLVLGGGCGGLSSVGSIVNPFTRNENYHS